MQTCHRAIVEGPTEGGASHNTYTWNSTVFANTPSSQLHSLQLACCSLSSSCFWTVFNSERLDWKLAAGSHFKHKQKESKTSLLSALVLQAKLFGLGTLWLYLPPFTCAYKCSGVTGCWMLLANLFQLLPFLASISLPTQASEQTQGITSVVKNF